MNCALLLAAGSGKRMKGAVQDKVLAPIQGKPVISYSIEAFARSGLVDTICVVHRDAEQREALAKAIGAIEIRLIWAEGGNERQDSVLRGLEALPDGSELVFIHDCARPLIRAEAIQQLGTAALADGAACLAHPTVDAIKRIETAGEIRLTTLEDLERSRLWAMETPQAFRLSEILRAYQHVRDTGLMITDDTAAAAILGQKTTLIPNDHPNPKLTTAADLKYIEWLLSR